MQSTSALYNDILAADNHWFETKVKLNNVEYGENKLFSVHTQSSMFAGNPEVGKAISAEIDVSVLKPDVSIPKMAKIEPFVRICAELTPGTVSQSEWLPKGVFYIDTREVNEDNNSLKVLKLHGYDAMLFAEAMYPSTTHNWPMTDTDVVDEIAAAMGVAVDSRTYDIMTEDYDIPLPASYSMREVLCNIAAMYVGSFVMTDEGKLRLVSLLELPPETNYLIDNAGEAITFGGDRILV